MDHGTRDAGVARMHGQAAHRATKLTHNPSSKQLLAKEAQETAEERAHKKAQQKLRHKIAEKILHSHADLLDLFEQWDEEGNELLSEENFVRGVSQLLHLKSDSMRSAVSELFRDLDEAGTGHLAYRELHDMLKPLMWAPRLERGTATRRSLARASSAARCSVRPAAVAARP